MKNINLSFTILLIFFVIAITYILHVNKSEAPEHIPLKPITEKYKVASRSVIVPQNVLNLKKTVLLTIDDGPSSRSMEMIDILKKHNAKAIFFINGMYDKRKEGIIKSIHDEGFEIGNHTWSHLNLKKLQDVKLIEEEINNNTELIIKLTGSSPRFFRSPYGESNNFIRKYIKDNGMILMNWSGTAMDWNKSTAEKDIFVGNVMNNIHSGSIILIHEHPWSVLNLDALLYTLESNGYTYIDPKDIIE